MQQVGEPERGGICSSLLQVSLKRGVCSRLVGEHCGRS